MIDSKCVYPWNETLYNFRGPFEISVSNTDESVTQIIRHQQFFVTLILARPANLALFFAEFQVSLRYTNCYNQTTWYKYSLVSKVYGSKRSVVGGFQIW